MERAGTLINKLKEQFEQQATAEKMAVTAQMLLVELQQNFGQQSSSSSNVSVVLPKITVAASVKEPVPSSAKEAVTVATPDIAEAFSSPEQPSQASEIPTLAHQTAETAPVQAKKTHATEVFEFNTVLANRTESLNEKLKEHRVEVASALQETPIRDLKKAIGLNDRFLFVNELFRGDENMYERSLKTINGFAIYPEAEYWIQRELKVKLSWGEDNEAVKIFDQLVKRRFS